MVCEAQNFVVYFEWDRSNLSPEALRTIEAAVAEAQRCTITAIDVVGFADTSGAPTYNVGLSNRRAAVVREALMQRGVDVSSITTSGRGESGLARQTGDNVREPLNRRTEVVIRVR